MNLIQRVINLIKRALNPKAGETSSTTEKISPKTGEITPASGELAPEKKALGPTPAEIFPKTGETFSKTEEIFPKTEEKKPAPKTVVFEPREKSPIPGEITATTAEKSPAPSIAPSEKSPEHILVRCASCGKDECVVECGKEALTHIYGDVLIETAKCAECGRFRLPVPVCVAECPESPKKTPLAIVSVEEKRKTAASALRYYSN